MPVRLKAFRAGRNIYQRDLIFVPNIRPVMLLWMTGRMQDATLGLLKVRQIVLVVPRVDITAVSVVMKFHVLDMAIVISIVTTIVVTTHKSFWIGVMGYVSAISSRCRTDAIRIKPVAPEQEKTAWI